MHGRVHEHQTELQGHESSAEDHLHQGVEGGHGDQDGDPPSVRASEELG